MLPGGQEREAFVIEQLMDRIRRDSRMAVILLFSATLLAGAAGGIAAEAWKRAHAEAPAAQTQAEDPANGAAVKGAEESADSQSAVTGAAAAGREALRRREGRALLPIKLLWAQRSRLRMTGTGTARTVDRLLSASEKRIAAADLLRRSREVPEGEALWKAFSDAVIIGDSRAEGFSVYHFLKEERVLAEISSTVADIDTYLDRLDKLKPHRIFISYGINDLAIYPSMSAEEYADMAVSKALLLKKRYPEAVVCLNSILPAQEAALERGPIWKRIPEYSEAIRKACEKEGICYIDNFDLAEEHKDLYADDGVHMSSDFYPLWAQNMLRSAQVYEARQLLEEEGQDE